MNPLRKLSITIVCVVACLGMQAQSRGHGADPPISIEVDVRAVHAAGLTPGGACVVVVSWRAQQGGTSMVMETWRDARADSAGSIKVGFEAAAPGGRLIAVIDVASGRMEIDTGDGSAFERVELPPARLRRNAQREVEAIASPQPAASSALSYRRRRDDEDRRLRRDPSGLYGQADRRVRNGHRVTAVSPPAMTRHNGALP